MRISDWSSDVCSSDLYGMDNIDPDKSLKLLVVEASDRILSGLPPRLSNAAAERLNELGVEMHNRERIVEVRADGMLTADGTLLPASMMVWSAGQLGRAACRERVCTSVYNSVGA